MKNIVICFDGTGNEIARPERYSNVVKLHATLEIAPSQISYYHPGVGTMGSPSARSWFSKQLTRYLGLAFGFGLMANVTDGYRYLMDTYEDGDRIFLFGFSRGAYTIRVLGGLLHVFGLLRRGNSQLIPYVFRMFKKMSRAARGLQPQFGTNEAFKWVFSRSKPVEIHFCGLWDTVSSYGWLYSPVRLPFEGMNPIIRIGRQALAIHERRCLYAPLLWGKCGPDQNFRQVWFSGGHSDVGGSYDETESGLSKISLEWMLCEAAKAGLLLSRYRVSQILGGLESEPPVVGYPVQSRPDHEAASHDELSRHLFWKFCELLPMRDPQERGKIYLPKGRPRNVPLDDSIHQSVIERTRMPDFEAADRKIEFWSDAAFAPGSITDGTEAGSHQ